MASTPYPIADLQAMCLQIAKAAGQAVAGAAGADRLAAHTKSSATDVTTAMDVKAEQLIRQMIRARRPQDAILGEEGGTAAGSSGLTWVVDPIDGTVNYTYGLPDYAISVAVVAGPGDPAGWRILAGCVHAPARQALWWAGAGLGAYANGRRLRLRQAVAPGLSLTGTGFGYRPEKRQAQAAELAGLLHQLRDIRRAGSAAIDLCHVADGRLDAFYERGLNPWDMAAGALVVTEAGGVVAGPGGSAPSSELTVAGPEATVRWLVEHLSSRRANLSRDSE
ncbi:MAG: inositol monophosphatase [Bifidobacteriaceae bacterium]|jgi:myo-inositol-1(or 4)-monophosphatase|nr:inositol monophosphatase [Bifidobacteriaceae bacterium]